MEPQRRTEGPILHRRCSQAWDEDNAFRTLSPRNFTSCRRATYSSCVCSTLPEMMRISRVSMVDKFWNQGCRHNYKLAEGSDSE